MKNKIVHIRLVKSGFFLLLFSLVISCKISEWSVPQSYTGQWKTDNEKITVRYKLHEDDRHSQFIHDSAVVTMKINQDKTASGSIGLSAFKNGKILKNYSLWETGVSYVIHCGQIGKIFEKDPVEVKEVEIWLGQMNENGKIKAELRLGGGSVFPMADLLFDRMTTPIE